MVVVQMTVKGHVDDPTNLKREHLDFEYHGFQWWMQFGIDKGIYSAYKGGKTWNHRGKEIHYREYPLIVTSQTSRLIECVDERWVWWRIPTRKRLGIGMWLPIRVYKPIPEGAKLCDSLIIYNHEKDRYDVRLVFEQDVPHDVSRSRIIAVDIGQKVLATVCDGSRPLFLGRCIRGIRRKYNWLRQRLQERKLHKVLERLASKEKANVERVLHETTRHIVEMARKTRAIIAVGDLQGMREKAKTKGRLIRRMISNFSYHKFVALLIHKAQRAGLLVIQLNEAWTSQKCSQCGSKGERTTQSSFHCPHCNYAANADWNAAKNIHFKMKLAMSYMPIVRAVASAPERVNFDPQALLCQ